MTDGVGSAVYGGMIGQLKKEYLDATSVSTIISLQDKNGWQL